MAYGSCTFVETAPLCTVTISSEGYRSRTICFWLSMTGAPMFSIDASKVQRIAAMTPRMSMRKKTYPTACLARFFESTSR